MFGHRGYIAGMQGLNMHPCGYTGVSLVHDPIAGALAAGIPTASGGSVGQRLRLCLKHRPHEFVSVVLSELQAAFQPASSSHGGRRGGGVEVAEQRRSMLEDIIYFWMLAEAYVQHPAIQADMRCTGLCSVVLRCLCAHACMLPPSAMLQRTGSGVVKGTRMHRWCK